MKQTIQTETKTKAEKVKIIKFGNQRLWGSQQTVENS